MAYTGKDVMATREDNANRRYHVEFWDGVAYDIPYSAISDEISEFLNLADVDDFVMTEEYENKCHDIFAKYINSCDAIQVEKPSGKEKHYYDLLNQIIDHVSNCEDTSATVKTLLNWGFTTEDLVQDFNFSEADVKDCLEDMNDFDPIY